MPPPLDLGPQTQLLRQPQCFFFSALLRASYWPNVPGGDELFAAAGPYTYYQSTLSDPNVPNWFGLDYGSWQVLAFAGTSNVTQWSNNVLGVGQSVKPPWPGRINNYFGNAATTQLGNVLTVMGAHSPLNNVVCLGHSLGGGIANLVGYALNVLHPGSVKWVCTEGGVRVGDLAWALGPTWPILAFRNSGDIIPYVPPNRGSLPSWVLNTVQWGPCQDYFPVGDEWVLTPSGGFHPQRVNYLAQPDAALLNQLYTQGLNPNALSHSVGQYAQRILFWAGGLEGLYQGSPFGINQAAVYNWQATFGATDGFVWKAQFN
jgi:hypothetical protein